MAVFGRTFYLDFKRSTKSIFKDAFGNLLIAGQIIGTIAYPMNCLQSGSSSSNISWSKHLAVLQTGWTLAIATAACCSPFVLFFCTPELFTLRRGPLFTQIFYCVKYLSEAVFVGCVLVGGQVYRQKYNAVLDGFLNVMNEFEREELTSLLFRCKTRFNALGCAMSCSLLALVTIMISLWSSVRIIPKVVNLFLGNAISGVWLLQYAFLLMVVKEMTELLNTNMTNILNRLPLDCNVGHSGTRKTNLEDLRKLRILHLRLGFLVDSMNRTVGAFLVLEMITIFCNLNIQCLILYQLYSNKFSVLMRANCFNFIFLKCSQLLLLVYPNAAIQQQNQITSSLLATVSKHDDRIMQSLIKRYLKQLGHVQAAHRVFGTVDIDLKVLLAMFGALSTFMVMLIQLEDKR